jgi:hypothetical protein
MPTKLQIARSWRAGGQVHVVAYEVVPRAGQQVTEQYEVAVSDAGNPATIRREIRAALKAMRDERMQANPASKKAPSIGDVDAPDAITID